MRGGCPCPALLSARSYVPHPGSSVVGDFFSKTFIMEEQIWIISIFDLNTNGEIIYSVPETLVDPIVDYVSETYPDFVISHAPLEDIEECEDMYDFKEKFYKDFEIE